MFAFWVVAGLLAAAAAGLVLHRASAAAAEAPFDPTLAVYRRQLAEIDELAERGLIAPSEQRSAHAEAGRRLLGAADAPLAAWRGERAHGRIVLAAAAAAAAAALALYLFVGQPERSDQAYARRLAAWRAADPASLAPPELAAVLQTMTRERPNDPEAFRFLALARGASGDAAGAVRALNRAVELAPERADLRELLGQAELARAGGDVSPEAEAAFRDAVRLDRHAYAARFHLGRAQVARGDRVGAIAAWRALLADMPAADPRRDSLTQAIAEAEGQRAAPAAVPADQRQMIQGMVDRLAARLAGAPDDPEGWVRLVRAYAVLGDAAKRDQALAAARQRYAGRAEVLGQLDAAARAEPTP